MSYVASPLTEVKMGARGPFDELASRPWEVRGSNDTPIGFMLLKPRKASVRWTCPQITDPASYGGLISTTQRFWPDDGTTIQNLQA